MGLLIHFHSVDLENLFSIIGSADPSVLRIIGVQPGDELRVGLDESDEDEYYEDDEEDDEELDDDEDAEEQLDDWDYEEEEETSAKEVITKMIMAGIPPDLAENEVAAILDFMANYAVANGIAQPVDVDEVIETADAEDDPDFADAIRSLLLEGIDEEELAAFIDYLLDRGASQELTTRLQMLCYGRLPESEESAFIETDESALSRSGYLTQNEVVQVVDELGDIADEGDEEHGYIPRVLAALFHYCNVNSKDLFCIASE